HGLAPARQVGGDAVDLLRAAGRPAVAGDHLVEHQQRAVPVAQGAHPGEIARWRFVQGGGGFHDDAGDVVPGEQGVEGGQVAVGAGDGGRGGDAGVHGGGADEPVADGDERLQADRDGGAAGDGAGQADGGGGGVGAVLGEFHHVGARHQVEEGFGGVEFEAGGAGEVDAVGDGGGDGVDDGPVAVAEGDRPQSHTVFDEFVAVAVGDAAAVPAYQDRGHVFGILVGAAGVGVGAAGHEFVQAGLGGVASGEVGDHGGIFLFRLSSRSR